MSVNNPVFLRKIFPRTGLRIAGEGAERSEAGEGLAAAGFSYARNFTTKY